MLSRKLLILTGALVLSVPTVAHAEPREEHFEDAPTTGPVGSVFKPSTLNSDAKVTVVVELTGDPVAVVQGRAGAPLPEAQASKIRSGLKKSQDRVKSEIRSHGGKVLSQMQSAYNGMRVSVPRNKLTAIAALPGVKSVRAVPIRTVDNATSVPFLGIPQVWQNSKFRGERVRVAIIDSGIDYTHADFGGPGTVEAYQAARKRDTFTPTARVKGGWDFVGDDYDASDADKATPKPDANPLDCFGHGTHVAGTAAGGGVTADGKAYTGPYDASTPSRKWTIGPGVAPKADLYALKVIGCAGSTTVTIEAIDWAVKHHMQVINMSLGSSYGTADDPDAVAAANAQAAGIIVVTAAGNAGPNPYLVDSPSAGRGVISVSAMDSVATYPGATLKFGGATMAAINANDAQLPARPFTIVPLVDDPKTTTVNEALGCTPKSFAFSGVKAGSNQVAVVQRGVCARVRKAASGQQAGAAAVIQINTDGSYPPFEGTIAEVPADPDLEPPLPAEDYTVTIPFLGVRAGDGPELRAAAGKSLTLTASILNNPAYQGYAAFSSGGPRSGDSGLRPSVSAPGVNITSAGVGTGNGPATLSGTSMAAPHVAGVAALARQAHRSWTSAQISAALTTTADPSRVAGYRLTLGGGRVDAKQVVSTNVFAIGDRYTTGAGRVYEGTLSFGFREPSSSYSGTNKLTLVNKGSKRVTFRLKNAPTSQSVPATIRLSRSTVVVPARSSRTVSVRLSVQARKVGSSLTDASPFALYEASGNITITSNGQGTLRVPYLMVPRAQAKVAASQTLVRAPVTTHGQPGTTTVTPAPTAPPTKAPSAPRYATVKLTNRHGALPAAADIYTWGLTDTPTVNPALPGGLDLRAAGVQSFDSADGQLLVFAVNNWTRWSNAAANEFDVLIDTDRDGDPDFIVFSADSGKVRNDDFDGQTEVFIYDIATKALASSGFMAQAPTDSSTILIPVLADDLGITAKTGAFDYTVESYSAVDDTAMDAFTRMASYNPWKPAISNGDLTTVPANGSRTVQLTIDPQGVADQKPLGTMVVVVDNKSGSDEALLLRRPKL